MNARTRVFSSHPGRSSRAQNSVPTPTSSAARWNQGETYRVPGSLFQRQALFILLLRRDDHPETLQVSIAAPSQVAFLVHEISQGDLCDLDASLVYMSSSIKGQRRWFLW